MTRRSIYIGIAAVLALALTTGFAYGAGAMHRTRAYNHPAGFQRVRTTNMVPGSFWDDRGQASQVSGYGPAFRSQMHGWMQNRMRNQDRNERSWTPMGYSRHAAQRAMSTSSADSSGTHNGYWDDHPTTSGHWGGSGSGGHGYHHGNGHDGDHDCW